MLLTATQNKKKQLPSVQFINLLLDIYFPIIFGHVSLPRWQLHIMLQLFAKYLQFIQNIVNGQLKATIFDSIKEMKLVGRYVLNMQEIFFVQFQSS